MGMVKCFDPSLCLIMWPALTGVRQLQYVAALHGNSCILSDFLHLQGGSVDFELLMVKRLKSDAQYWQALGFIYIFVTLICFCICVSSTSSNPNPTVYYSEVHCRPSVRFSLNFAFLIFQRNDNNFTSKDFYEQYGLLASSDSLTDLD